MAAHLAGAVAANTTLPVVGVPLSGGALNGVDALYATVQMPKGMPVATVAIDGAMNAALLVVQMLAITDADLARRLDERRRPPDAQTVIPRYSLPKMAALFTDEAKLALWLEVEVLATEAWSSLGVVPARRRQGGPRAGAHRRRRLRGRGRRARAHHRPRRRRLRRRRPGRPSARRRATGCTTG